MSLSDYAGVIRIKSIVDYNFIFSLAHLPKLRQFLSASLYLWCPSCLRTHFQCM